LSPSFRFPASILAGQVYEDRGSLRDAELRYAASMSTLRDRAQAAPESDYVLAAMALATPQPGIAPVPPQLAERATRGYIPDHACYAALPFFQSPWPRRAGDTRYI
jgi:hypothetical protein